MDFFFYEPTEIKDVLPFSFPLAHNQRCRFGVETTSILTRVVLKDEASVFDDSAGGENDRQDVVSRRLRGVTSPAELIHLVAIHRRSCVACTFSITVSFHQ